MYVTIHVGDSQWTSPAVRIDTVIGLLGRAPQDIQLGALHYPSPVRL
jgi:hypothetical protein